MKSPPPRVASKAGWVLPMLAVAATGSCGSGAAPDSSTSQSSDVSRPLVASDSGEETSFKVRRAAVGPSAMPHAAARIEEIQARFSGLQPPRLELGKSEQRVPVILEGDDLALRVDGDSLAPVRRRHEGQKDELRARLPQRALESVRVEDPGSGMGAAFRLRGASDAEPVFAHGLAFYERGGPGGSSLLIRTSATSVEDFVVFDGRTEVLEIRYEVELQHAAGLRLVSNTLELLDATGTPRIRVAPPYVVDARGAHHAASLQVAGCEFDSSPVAPWGRTPTSPGSGSCELRVSWDNGVEYPAVLDPKWSGTAEMVAPRNFHTASKLNDGRVLVAGDYLSEPPTEIFDPATETWAAAGTPVVSRFAAASATLNDGRVLVVGGACSGGCSDASPFSKAELYDPTSGTWSVVANSPARGSATATVLPDGRVLLAGGAISSTWPQGVTSAQSLFLFDPASSTWTELTEPKFKASLHTASLLKDGRVLLTGGISGLAATPVSNLAFFFDPKTEALTPAPPMKEPRLAHAAAVLADGRVLIAGGRSSLQATEYLATGELFDPATNSWSPPFPVSPRSFFGAAVRLDGTVVFAGGAPGPNGEPAAELLLLADMSTHSLEMPGGVRDAPSATLLNDGRVLVAGGRGVNVGPPTSPSSLLLDAEPFKPVVDAGTGGAGGDAGALTCGSGTTKHGDQCVADEANDGCSCRVRPQSAKPTWLLFAILALVLARTRANVGGTGNRRKR